MPAPLLSYHIVLNSYLVILLGLFIEFPTEDVKKFPFVLQLKVVQPVEEKEKFWGLRSQAGVLGKPRDRFPGQDTGTFQPNSSPKREQLSSQRSLLLSEMPGAKALIQEQPRAEDESHDFFILSTWRSSREGCLPAFFLLHGWEFS